MCRRTVWEPMVALTLISSGVSILCAMWFCATETVAASPIAAPICVYDVKIVEVSRLGVALSGADDVRVRLVVDTPEDVDIIRFASNFGLTLCYEGGRAFLPNATPDFF